MFIAFESTIRLINFAAVFYILIVCHFDSMFIIKVFLKKFSLNGSRKKQPANVPNWKKNFFFNPIFRFFAQNGELKSKTKENKNMNK